MLALPAASCGTTREELGSAFDDPLPIMEDVSAGRIVEVERWIASGGDVNQPKFAGDSLLTAAVVADSTTMVELLIENGAQVFGDEHDGSGWSGLLAVACAIDLTPISNLAAETGG